MKKWFVLIMTLLIAMGINANQTDIKNGGRLIKVSIPMLMRYCSTN